MAGSKPAKPRVIVIMGVSASGKTSVGQALAERLDCTFEEGDDLHPAGNIAKMKAGHPLDDADRVPWLDAVARWIERQLATGQCGVISCSALKRSYRDRLREADADIGFILMDPDPETLRRRLTKRVDHFMPPALLASQLATLERPGPDERALRLSSDEGIADNVAVIVRWLSRDDGPDRTAAAD